MTGGAAHHVAAVVHAIGEVDVQVAWFTEHDLISRGPAAEGVARFVHLIVGLGLDDPDDHGLPIQISLELAAKQTLRNLLGR